MASLRGLLDSDIFEYVKVCVAVKMFFTSEVILNRSHLTYLDNLQRTSQKVNDKLLLIMTLDYKQITQFHRRYLQKRWSVAIRLWLQDIPLCLFSTVQ